MFPLFLTLFIATAGLSPLAQTAGDTMYKLLFGAVALLEPIRLYVGYSSNLREKVLVEASLPPALERTKSFPCKMDHFFKTMYPHEKNFVADQRPGLHAVWAAGVVDNVRVARCDRACLSQRLPAHGVGPALCPNALPLW